MQIVLFLRISIKEKFADDDDDIGDEWIWFGTQKLQHDFSQLSPEAITILIGEGQTSFNK